MGSNLEPEVIEEYIKAENKRRFEIARSIGSEEPTVDEYAAAREKSFDLFEQYVIPRSFTAKCKLGLHYYPECKGIDSIGSDTDFGSEESMKRYRELFATAMLKAVSEAMTANKRALERLEAKGQEIAAAAEQACNRNGIYE